MTFFTQRIPLVALLAAGLALAGCDNVLDVNPTASIDTREALTTPGKVAVAVSGAYDVLQPDEYYGGDGFIVVPDLYADDLDATGTFTNLRNIDRGNVTADNVSLLTMWSVFYDGINRANSILSAIPNVEGFGAGEAEQYTGEALFLRALHYFNLVNVFGDVPLVLEPTFSTDQVTHPARATAAQVYAQIVADLSRILDEGLLGQGGGPGRATEGAARALLARVHLYQGNYAEAEALADEVIRNYGYRLVAFADLYQSQNTAEAIFEVQFNQNDNNNLAFYFFPASNADNPVEAGGRRQFAPSESLYVAYDEGDVRRDRTIGVAGSDLYGRKYFRIANSDDHVIVLRLAEMHLIRAEANARTDGPLSESLADLNLIRTRAGLDAAEAASADEVLDLILEERRREFALENHRYFDLRRYGRAEEVLGLTADRLYFPIPQAERDRNPNL